MRGVVHACVCSYMCDRAVPLVQLQLSSTLEQVSGTLQTWGTSMHFSSEFFTTANVHIRLRAGMSLSKSYIIHNCRCKYELLNVCKLIGASVNIFRNYAMCSSKKYYPHEYCNESY